MRSIETSFLSGVLRGEPDDEIVALESRLRAAQLSADITALEHLIDDDLLFAGPDGRLATKADDLAAHASGVVRFRTHEPRELCIRRIGSNVAVVSLVAWLVVEVAGTSTEGNYRYTRVWARGKGKQW
jgi:hypothetical protein